MSFFGHPLLLKLGGQLLVALGLSWLIYAAFAGDTVLTRYYRKYTAQLDRSLKLLFMPAAGERIVLGQALAACAVTALGLAVDLPYWYLGLFPVAFGPVLWVRTKRTEHITRLESQLDALILGLANSLKTVPSPSAALGAIVPVLPFTVTRMFFAWACRAQFVKASCTTR